MKTTDFAKQLHHYFGSYLPMQLNLSANTIRSYRDAFTLLLRYCRDQRGLAVERFGLDQFDSNLVEGFLRHIESDRGCSVSTRNQRLAAIHAFVRFLLVEEPARMLQWQQILAIPVKRTERKTPVYLEAQELQTLLEHVDTGTPTGYRDTVLLSVLYDTGARVQEVVDLCVRDVRLDQPPQIRLTGKGRKTRVVPLMQSTAELLHDYIDRNKLRERPLSDQPLFVNRYGQQYTRSGIAYMVRKYAAAARPAVRSLPFGMSPHVFRHSKAMHMLQGGVPLIIIRDFLGHADMKTSEVYARVDMDAKRKALESLMPNTPSSTVPSWTDDAVLMEWLKSL